MVKRTIVLVDDDTNLLASVERVLACDAYEIFTFDNPVDAGGLIDSLKGDVDLVISDNKMPRLKGTEFLIGLRQEYPDIIRIMMTGESDIKDAQCAINEGEVYRFLMKPVDPYELELVVKRALAHKDLFFANKKLAEKVTKQEAMLETLEKEHPGITQVTRDEEGTVILSETYYYKSFDEYMKKHF